MTSSAETAASVFEYDCEAVRVFARRLNKAGQEETRKFSVDPNLTNYEILTTILARAFDIQGDFAVAYCSVVPPSSTSPACSEWLPMLSDWDLDSAIISSADPSLNLIVTERKFKTVSRMEEEERGEMLLTEGTEALQQVAVEGKKEHKR